LGVVLRSHADRQHATRRKAHHTDALRVDAPLGCALAHHPHGLQTIVDRDLHILGEELLAHLRIAHIALQRLLEGIVVGGRLDHTVAQHKGGDAALV
jgi:hypothetical protein